MTEADRMRDRLRALARADRQPLAADLESRLAERLRAEGPSLVRRSYQRRAALRAAAVALPLALAGAWLGSRSPIEPPQPEVAARPVVAAPVAVAPACATRPLPRTELVAQPNGWRYVDLAERGRIVLAPATEARLVSDDPCRLEVQLVQGRVTVHAANLFGGELKVSAGAADVVVHGTKFAVERASERLTVVVEEGAVGIVSRGRALAPLVRAGQELRMQSAQTPVVHAVSQAARAQLQAALDAPLAAVVAESDANKPDAAVSDRAPPSRSAAASSAAKLVVRADALWQSGARDEARARYREAGAASGPTAEAAWLALARRELSVGDARAALDTLASYWGRFPSGELAAEAAGIEFRAALSRGDIARAERLARKLVARHAGTPQAEAAARWLRDEARP